MSERQRAIPDLRLLHDEMVERIRPLAIFSPSDWSALTVTQCVTDEVLALISDLELARTRAEDAMARSELLTTEFRDAIKCLEK